MTFILKCGDRLELMGSCLNVVNSGDPRAPGPRSYIYSILCAIVYGGGMQEVLFLNPTQSDLEGSSLCIGPTDINMQQDYTYFWIFIPYIVCDIGYE